MEQPTVFNEKPFRLAAEVLYRHRELIPTLRDRYFSTVQATLEGDLQLGASWDDIERFARKLLEDIKDPEEYLQELPPRKDSWRRSVKLHRWTVGM